MNLADQMYLETSAVVPQGIAEEMPQETAKEVTQETAAVVSQGVDAEVYSN